MPRYIDAILTDLPELCDRIRRGLTTEADAVTVQKLAEITRALIIANRFLKRQAKLMENRVFASRLADDEDMEEV